MMQDINKIKGYLVSPMKDIATEFPLKKLGTWFSLLILGISSVFILEHIIIITRAGMTSFISNPSILLDYLMIIIWLWITFSVIKRRYSRNRKTKKISTRKLVQIPVLYIMAPAIILMVLYDLIIYSHPALSSYSSIALPEKYVVSIAWMILAVIILLIMSILGKIRIVRELQQKSTRFYSVITVANSIGWGFLIISAFIEYLIFYLLNLVYSWNIMGFPAGIILVACITPFFVIFITNYYTYISDIVDTHKSQIKDL